MEKKTKTRKKVTARKKATVHFLIGILGIISLAAVVIYKPDNPSRGDTFISFVLGLISFIAIMYGIITAITVQVETSPDDEVDLFDIL